MLSEAPLAHPGCVKDPEADDRVQRGDQWRRLSHAGGQHRLSEQQAEPENGGRHRSMLASRDRREHEGEQAHEQQQESHRSVRPDARSAEQRRAREVELHRDAHHEDEVERAMGARAQLSAAHRAPAGTRVTRRYGFTAV